MHAPKNVDQDKKHNCNSKGPDWEIVLLVETRIPLEQVYNFSF